MIMTERISCEEIISIYNIEITFINALEDSGLIHPEIEDEIKYILHDELTDLERFVNWHYEMEVNMPGIEVIHRLITQIETLQQENRRLLKQTEISLNEFIDM